MAKAKEEIYTLTFTKQELIVIFNLLVSTPYKFAELAAVNLLVAPLVKRIEPIVAVDSNIPAERQGKPNGVILDK